jgi:hypothetical protein
LTTWWMVDVALGGVLPWSTAITGEVASMTTIEIDVARA